VQDSSGDIIKCLTPLLHSPVSSTAAGNPMAREQALHDRQQGLQGLLRLTHQVEANLGGKA
jgi:hypothetical protein